MIVQEPVQAAIWHCLNHYDYSDAIFLSERLYAEVKTDDSLYLLATAYYRNGQIDHAYHVLKDKAGASPQCRYLLGSCAYKMQKYTEAESALTDGCTKNGCVDDLVSEYEDQAAFVLLLLAKISRKTGRQQQAVDAYRRALRLNPFLWSAFESMCDMGERPSPTSCFRLDDVDSLLQCHGSEPVVAVATAVNNTAAPTTVEACVATPILTSSSIGNSGTNVASTNICTPDDNPAVGSLYMSGLGLLPSTRFKSTRFRIMDNLNIASPVSPMFGHLIERSEDGGSPGQPPSLSDANELKSFTKKVRAHMGNLISRKDPILQNSKPVFSQTAGNTPGTPSPPAQPTGPNVRRSSRLFSSNSYSSVKENSKSPKFVTPKSPSRKTKQRVPKCTLNEFNAYMDMNAKNSHRMLKKEKAAETVTSSAAPTTTEATLNVAAVVQLQKQSAEGLMSLLRELGQAYVDLSQFECKSAVEQLGRLPPHQFQTAWVYSLLGVAHFELADYENCVRYFSEVHSREPYRVRYMDYYSTALWHLQKEVALSALAQDLIALDKSSPITWIVAGNCFSLHKEHDTAIKFLHRAVQVEPSYPYAYTLLGHEYITTEELDKAMSCYRNAVRHDPRHYNAWFGIGTIYSKQERFHLAEMNYSRALAINRHSSVILCHIGVVQHALKKTDKALATFNAAIAKDPKNALCKFHRGSIYFAVGRHSEALKELEELKEIVPKESVVYYLIGKVHKKLGNTDLALMHFSWATDLDPKGASSQIKEAFDPSIGRNGAADDSPASPQTEEYPSEANQEAVSFAGLQDDSDDSL